jgi:hypothetical protein
VKALAALVLVGCFEPTPEVLEPSFLCTVDADCGTTTVCARTGECLAPDEVRTAQVIWTKAGEPPTERSCYWYPTVHVEFWTDPEQPEVWRSGAVACTLGTYTVDKLPLRFWIGGAKSPEAGMWVPLDDNGVAHVDVR